MKTVVSCFQRTAFAAAVSASLVCSPLMLAPAAMAQETVRIHPTDQTINGPRDAALEATRDGDYLAARELAKKAAAAGQPLDADQVDFINGKAEQQERQQAAQAKLKAEQAAAAAQVIKIQKRQQAEDGREASSVCWETKGGGDRLGAAVNNGAGQSIGKGGSSTNLRTSSKAQCEN